MLTPRVAETRRVALADAGVGPAQRVDELAHHALDAGDVLHGFQHDEELVAAQARDEVARAHVAAQALRDFDQEGVAGGVAVAVVDLLEAVEVDEDAGELRAVAPRALDRLLERRREAHAVGEPGERVAVGERGDALARERDLGDVAADAAVAEEVALRVVARLAAHREVARGAVGQARAPTRSRGTAGGSRASRGAPASRPRPGAPRRAPTASCRAAP